MAGLSNLVVHLQLIADSESLRLGLDSGAAALGKFAGAAVSAGAVLGSAMAAGAMVATDQLLSLNRELNVLSESLNISRESLQLWQIAGETVGINSEKMGDIFKDVNDKLGDFASTGGGEAVDLINRLGLNINELIAMSPDQALLKIADAMEKTTDMSTAEKTFLLESLADDASRLLPLLKDGASALDAIKERASTNLVIITDEQKAILDAANAKMAELGSSLDGLSHQAGTAGAMLVNAFGDDVIDAIDSVALMMQDLPDVAMGMAGDIADSWGYANDAADGALSDMAASAEMHFGFVGFVASETLEATRMGFTYMPVYASAAYTAISGYALAWMHDAAATYDAFVAGGHYAFAALLQNAKGSFVGVAEMGGQAVKFVLDRLADMAGGMASAVSVLNSIPGFEGVGAGIDGVEAKLRGMASTAGSAGASVGAAFDGAISSMNAAGKAAEMSSLQNKQWAAESRLSAMAAVDAGQAFIAQKESQRGINAQIREENQALGGLASGYEKASGTAKKYHVNQDAVNKALGDGAGGAAKAKAAKSDLEKQTDKLSKAYADELEQLKLKAVELSSNSEEYYRAKLASKDFTSAMQDEAVVLHYSNTILEARKKLTQEANAVKLNPLEQYKDDLQQQGVTAGDIAALAAEKQQIIQAKITQELEKQRKKAELTAEEFAEWETLQEGVTAEFARQTTEYSKLTAEIEKQRELSDKLRESLVDAFVDAAESGFSSFDSLKDYVEQSFSDLVIRPAIEGVMGDVKAGKNPWESLQQQFGQAYGNMQAGGIAGATAAAGAAMSITAVLGGGQEQQIGSAVGAAIGNAIVPVIGGAIGGLLGNLAGGLFEDDDSARASFTGGRPTDGYAFTDRNKTLYASSRFGQFGFEADGTHDLGEDGEKKLEDFVKRMAEVDNALAQFIPAGEIDRIKGELSRYEKQGLDFASLFKDRLVIITSGLSDTMRGLIDYSQDADGIIAQINNLIAIQQQAVPALRDMGLQIGATDDAALAAAAGLAEAAGGLSNLVSISAAYYDAVYTEEERKATSLTNAEKAIDVFNASNGAQINSLASLRAYVEGLDQSNEANRKAAVEAMQLVDELQLLSDSGTSLADAANDATGAVDNLKDRLAFLQDVNDQLSDFNLSPVERELRDIERNFADLTERGRELGASESELLAVRALSDRQTQQVISNLKGDIAGLNSELFGLDYNQQISGLNDLLNAENDRMSELNAASQERYQEELANYEALQGLARGIGGYLDSLKLSDLATSTPAQLLEEAAKQYRDTLQKANSGDTEAAGDYQGALQAYLQQAQSYYGNSNAYQAVFNQSTQEAEQLQGKLGRINKPVEPSDIQSLVSRNLERQIELLEQQVEIDRKRDLAADIREKLRQLSLATGQDIAALAQELGLSLGAIEAALNGEVATVTGGTQSATGQAAQSSGSAVAVSPVAKPEYKYQTQAALFSDARKAGQSVSKIADIKDVAGLSKALGMTPEELRKNLQFLAPWLSGQWASYAVGSDFIPFDQTANVHKGETIFTRGQSASIRDNVVSAMAALSSIHHNMGVSGGLSADVLAELRGLREDNQRLAIEVQALRGQVAQYSSQAEQQRAQQITELVTQRRDNERKTATWGRV